MYIHMCALSLYTPQLHSLKFVGPKDKAPKVVKLYANRLHMGFDEADAVEPTQVLELTAADYDPQTATNLRFVKFQAVSSLIVRDIYFLFLFCIELKHDV